VLLDLKAACRELLKHRWFTCVTVLTLALGIGANAAIFGVVNKLLLNPLPYADANRLVFVGLDFPGVPFTFPMPESVGRALREETRTLDGVEAYTPRNVLAYDETGARALRGMRITPGLPGLLGVVPALGRGFTPADAEVGAPAVVMVSYEMWQRDYGRARDVLGRTLTLDEVAHVVVGVLPPGWGSFVLGDRPDVWFPLSLDSASESPMGFNAIDVLGRLRPGFSLVAAKQEIDTILDRELAAAPRPMFGGDDVDPRLDGPGDRFGGDAREALLLLLGAVSLVLLVACSNVANLLLARGASRARELSLRSALGASTWRLVRALLAECLVLALAAGAVGVALGWAILRILVRLRPDSLGAPLGEVLLDWRVLAFTLAVSVATAFLFGMAPAAQLTSRKLGNALRHGASGVVRGGSGARLRKLLVAGQMALSVVLLVSAGLLVRSFINLQSVEVGFDTENLLSAQLLLPRGRYEQPASRDLLAEQLLDGLRSMPGISAATQAQTLPPLYMMSGSDFEIRGVTLSEADANGARSNNYVRPNFFTTLGIRMLEGRTFTTDELRSGGAVIVSRAAAQHFWPEGNALGSELKWGSDWATVVGVADDVASGGLMRGKDEPQFYLPYQAERAPTTLGAPPSILLIVRATGDPAVAMASVRSATRALDPEIAIPYILPTEMAFASTIDGPRFNMALLTAFAMIALVLAAVGLAAVIGYEVAERTHEFGIRMALGARTESVRRQAMRHGLTPAFVGVVIGVVGALGATQLATSLLHGVAPRDPLTFVSVVVLLVLVAFGASWLPARRATRVDPITALRAE
jgi:putative ABC transport system permease protein